MTGEKVGGSVYQQLMHRLGLEVAECIETRMQVVRAKIGDVVRSRGQGRPARILSLGAARRGRSKRSSLGPMRASVTRNSRWSIRKPAP